MCLFTSKNEVTENKSTTVTFVEEQFEKKRFNNFDAFEEFIVYD